MATAGGNRACGVVTDNAAYMRRSWRLLQSEFPALMCNSCTAHAVNLLMKDMFEIAELKLTLSECVSLTEYVQKRSAHKYRNVTKSKRALALPVSTRCISHNRVVLTALFGDKAVIGRIDNKENV
ncbi:TPA: hypothetical protein N0F65_001097 [Lagenidium giganteum]|uniref:DUF659 domain-containing protein n=1 Tax=Lagenidium giganteum TaxID=4803 RepID=A0AAV2YH17_9STRA|nr:TPA: hypothetical protein N0F65_001097 [Lagenidium giganteum]